MSSFAGCFETVGYDENRGSYVGKSRSGAEMTFSSIGAYDAYVQSMEAVGNICPVSTVSQRFHNIYRGKSDGSVGETGFLEFKPRDPQTQLGYDAASPFWKGEKETIKAVDTGKYDENAVYVYGKKGETKQDMHKFQSQLYKSLNGLGANWVW